MTSDYEMVIGLETHVELRTRHKIFCNCPNTYGAAPNTCVCPTCMGLPGALPVFHRESLLLAAKAGLALHCTVHENSRFDRKNYFYPDLPKAYQITQFYHPLCEGGYVDIGTEQDQKRIGITRIHLEEDAGKLTHTPGGLETDLNRCGVPLIEIVTEPDLRSAGEAVAYLKKLRSILVYTDVSDCRMNEGSLRCDVNLSLRHPGAPLGVRTEIKNLNSFQSVERAIEAERVRQAALLDAGLPVVQETLRYDQKTGQTHSMRRKENSADYRYFPEPDLPPVHISHSELSELERSIPVLPDERRSLYMRQYGLGGYAAGQIAAERWLAELFEKAVQTAQSPAALANLILGEAFAQLTLRGEETISICPEHLAMLSNMAVSGRVNSTTAKAILAALFENDCDPEKYAREHSLLMLTDENLLRGIAQEVLLQNGALVQSYRAGRQNVAKALMGKAMGACRGRADAEKLRRILLELLNA